MVFLRNLNKPNQHIYLSVFQKNNWLYVEKENLSNSVLTMHTHINLRGVW
jgi:hypothetical protein